MTSHDVGQTWKCISYINGFEDGLHMAGSEAICPFEASRQAVIKIYVQYMDSHTKMLESKNQSDSLVPC
jgi:hypothetical protein